jgi:hypothetical protein
MEGYGQTPEAMQVAMLNEDDTSTVTDTTTLQESAVGEKIYGKGEAVRAKEEAAEGQKSVLRRPKEGENHPSNREETGNCKDKQGQRVTREC